MLKRSISSKIYIKSQKLILKRFYENFDYSKNKNQDSKAANSRLTQSILKWANMQVLSRGRACTTKKGFVKQRVDVCAGARTHLA